MAIDKTNIKHLTGAVLTEGAKGLVSVLDIDGSLYELHDKCVDEVVKEVDKIEARVTAVEETVSDFEDTVADVEELKETVEGTKTKVDNFLGDSETTLKDIDSKIAEFTSKTVTVTDSAVEGKYVTHVTKDAQGVISSEKADLTATVVKATKGTDNTTVQAWLEAIETALNADTGLVAKVQQIVKELTDSTGDTAWDTIVDKLRGLDTKTVKEYVDDAIDSAVGTVKTDLVGTAADTADKDTIKGAKKYADDKVAELESKLDELEDDSVKTVNEIEPDENGNVTITASDINITYMKGGESKTDTLEDFLDEREDVLASALNDLADKIDKTDIEEKTISSTTFNYAKESETLKLITNSINVMTKKANA